MPRITVAELIDYLSKMPQKDKEVVLNQDDDHGDCVVLDFIWSDMAWKGN